MLQSRAYLAAVAATMRRDAEIFLSYRMRLFAQVLGILSTLTIFYYVSKLVRPDAVGVGQQYFAYAVVGIVTTSVLTAALSSAEVIRMELFAGNFERILISPMGPVWGVVSVVAFPICYSTVFASAMVAVAVPLYGVHVVVSQIPAAVGVGVLGAFCLACIGMFFVAGLLAFKSALGATWVVAGLSLLGGAYFPLSLLPSWVRWTADVQPFTPTVQLLRHFLLGTKPVESVGLDLIKLVGFAIVLAPIAFRVLWLAVDLSRRRGTIMEY